MAEHDLPPADLDLLAVLRKIGDPGLTADTISLLDLPDHDVDQTLRRLIDQELLHQVTDPTGTVRYPATPAPDTAKDDDPASLSDTNHGPSSTVSQRAAQALARLVEHYTMLMSSIAETLEPGKHAYSDLRRSATPLADRATARMVFDREHHARGGTVMAVLRLAVELELWEWAWRLGEALWVPLRSGRHIEDVLLSQTFAVRAARVAGADDDLGHPYESTACARVAWAQSRLGRTADAAALIEFAVAVAEGHGDGRALATALSVSAQTLVADNRLDDAVAMFDRCIDLDIRNSAPPWVLGVRLRQQASALSSLGRKKEACRAARFAVGLIFGDPRPRGFDAARALIVYAEILLDLGLTELADEALIDANAFLDPDADRVHHADVQALLWTTATVLGQPDAEQHRGRAITAYEQAGDSRRATELRAHPTPRMPVTPRQSTPPPSQENPEPEADR
ncbi:hypothetical protein [Umezawaea sp. Da 62-37]|uniref:hypothetical protein n=1 Tax=Umezawaea sp. Da 62-37 TaxID=3075927 RepID=UPI0028F74EA7|nr:hypothetical protein [Umezawaea sp. Da 62-37]WNV83047.1 hypothetical protein RM788_33310 [Umezawaea sp. Da 62-37]